MEQFEKIKAMITKGMLSIGIVNDDMRVSITNITVYVFLFITAFRSLFGNMDISNDLIKWVVQPIDMSGTLPLLFSLINYSAKRIETNKMVLADNTKKETNGTI